MTSGPLLSGSAPGPASGAGPVGDPASVRKARGAFFTPDTLASYIADWAVRTPDDRVLEPSCGDAVFLVAAGRRLRELSRGAAALGGTAALSGAAPPLLIGLEVHEDSARRARHRLAEAGLEAGIAVGDFFEEAPEAAYDAVVGNPPYIRYQGFRGASASASRAAALRAGVALTRLASSWAAFTVHAAQFVRPGGRLGLVLPAELLTVNYAGPVREFLVREFGRVRLVVFTERVFPGVQEEVVLLLAEDRGGAPGDHCELLTARNADDLRALDDRGVRRWTPGRARTWSHVHLDPEAHEALGAVLAGSGFTTLHGWGETTLGMVTGANKFFTLTTAEARHRRIPPADLLRLSPPGSRHLRHLVLDAARLDVLDGAGSPTWLFRPGGGPSPASLRYIAAGEAAGVDTAYKCRVRSPWWRVPLVPPADLLLTYMNADTARLCTNTAGVHHLNSVHGVYLLPELRSLGLDVLPLASLNTVTLLGAELTGRSYGGGVLKLEPREADAWPMPAPELVERSAAALALVRGQVVEHLTSGRLLDAVDLVDGVLMASGAGIDADAVAVLRRARGAMHARRTARAGRRTLPL